MFQVRSLVYGEEEKIEEEHEKHVAFFFFMASYQVFVPLRALPV